MHGLNCFRFIVYSSNRYLVDDMLAKTLLCHYKHCETPAAVFPSNLCTGCNAVYYCTEYHQQKDNETHATFCHEINILQIRQSMQDPAIDDDLFIDVLEQLQQFGTVTAYERALVLLQELPSTMFDGLGQISTSSLKFDYGLGAILLRLERDQDCYDVSQQLMKEALPVEVWGFESPYPNAGVIDGRFEEIIMTYDNMTLSEIFTAKDEYSNRRGAEHAWTGIVGILLPKIKALRQLVDLHRSWLLASKIPLEVLYQIQAHMGDPILSGRRKLDNRSDVRSLLRELGTQIPRLCHVLHEVLVLPWELPNISIQDSRRNGPSDAFDPWSRVWRQAAMDIIGAPQILAAHHMASEPMDEAYIEKIIW